MKSLIQKHPWLLAGNSSNSYEAFLLIVHFKFRTMSEDVLSQIKTKNYDRYKIIVVITIGERFLQGLCMQSKNLWDPTKDFSVSYIEDNPRYFAIGICYGIYLE